MRRKGTGYVERMADGSFRPRLPSGERLGHFGSLASATAALDEALLSPPGKDLDPERREFASFVYFVRDIRSGAIKIGRSKNPDVRLVALKTGGVAGVEMLCVVPGGSRLERVLHVAFAARRMNGEWFDPNAELLSLVEELRALWSKP